VNLNRYPDGVEAVDQALKIATALQKQKQDFLNEKEVLNEKISSLVF